MTEPRDDVALRELVAAATPGPWLVFEDEKHRRNMRVAALGSHIAKVYADSTNDDDEKAINNAALIVAAVNALPRLLDRLERAEKALREIAEHDGVSYRFGDEVRAIARAALQPSKGEKAK